MPSTTKLTDEMKKEIGQHFVFGFHTQELDSDIKTLVGAPYYVGNVIFMKRNVRDVAQVKSMIRELQAYAKDAGHERPLLIGTDQENGLVSAFSSKTAVTQFPGAMTLASTGSVSLTEQVYAASAKELDLLGVNWAYAPVADINIDKRNPVIGVRSFGDDPHKVAEYVLAAAKGMSSSGVAPNVKHFPGHGDTHVDSHLALPKIMKTKEVITETELVPFKAAFDEAQSNPRLGSLLTVMTSHHALPLITGSDEPCSLSKLITTEILRKEMGFKGVVVTDCLEMDAIAATKDDDGVQGMGANGDRESGWNGGCGVEEGVVRALEAGADITMVCHTMARHVASVKRVWEAVESGRLSMDDIRKGGERIRRLKDAVFGQDGWRKVLEDRPDFEEEWKKAKAESKQISEAAYAKSTVLLKDDSMLPLGTGKVVLFTPENESYNKAVDDAEGVLRTKGGQVRNTAGAYFLSFHASIKRRVEGCDHIVYTKDGTIDAEEGTEQVIFVLRNADRSTWQISALKELLRRQPSKVVVLSSSTPYDLDGVTLASPYAHLASSEYTTEAFEAAAAVIFGERKAEGRLAVKL
ncbi:glycoside hydrolase [Moniliophthora roreri MCA 2997]|uniref:Glycoside hydrolase n=1 Tax=Moniliophthora roreri (strain MCA 2997) TaxID=1381753 RepID=V2WVF4_MONRO|nr:glycoside hydrolase [Moniliophthora roreri MCA 2997]